MRILRVNPRQGSYGLVVRREDRNLIYEKESGLDITTNKVER